MKELFLGTTYSHRHASYLGLDQDESLRAVFDLNLDLLRVGCYWQEIQPTQSAFDFSAITRILEACQQAKQKTIVTVGMKAPRWPEFYFPGWLPNPDPSAALPHVLHFLCEAVTRLKDYDGIAYWQVENEPLDPSGPKQLSIPFSVLEQEVALVRELDPTRPILVNLWGNALTKRGFLPRVNAISDAVGLNFYPKVAPQVSFLPGIYFGPADSDEAIAEEIAVSEHPVILTELQAEPWERSQKVAFSASPHSINPQLLVDNFERAKRLSPEGILFWGFEYWLWKKAQGDSRMWDTIDKIIQDN